MVAISHRLFGGRGQARRLDNKNPGASWLFLAAWLAPGSKFLAAARLDAVADLVAQIQE